LGYVALNFLPDTCPERILTATDRREKLVLLTTDRKLLEYPHLQARW
jgi:PIN domain nuclease of toxin-antitoxin system